MRNRSDTVKDRLHEYASSVDSCISAWALLCTPNAARPMAGVT